MPAKATRPLLPSKKERLIAEIADLVGAGKKWELPSVDFSDPNRPKTCLEVDFPIAPINEIAQIEGNAGKPIYQMSKWWARRRSSVFRAMLLSAATKAPDVPAQAAAKIWRAYYGNHQHNPAFQKLKVADLFMGGGTTLVEGSRLGMNLIGCELNPVAWFVVKNEITSVNLDEVKRLFAEIEAEVKPYLMPYFACDGPGGERGVWFRREKESEQTWQEMAEDFDIFCVPWQERINYRYKGPEIVYTFWAKHGPCAAQDCGHRTPLLTTPIVAIKTLTVDHWVDVRCAKCDATFDLERHPARMAPDVSLFVAKDEKPFAVMNGRGEYACPHCGHRHTNRAARVTGKSIELGGKVKSKKVNLTLLMHPEWMKGCDATDADGQPLGGSVTDDVESTIRWFRTRAKTLRFLEVRGTLPEIVTCPETKVTFSTKEGNLGTAGKYVCQEPACGRRQPVVVSVEKTGKTAPASPYMIQGYSPSRAQTGYPYSGRFFAPACNTRRYESAFKEWLDRHEDDLQHFWPRSKIPFGHMTHQRQPLAEHGYTHWWKMFDPLQLLVHSQLLKAITTKSAFSQAAQEAVLGAFQQYINFQNFFCHWNIQRDCIAQVFANNNFHPKATVVESAVFSKLGSGNWESQYDITGDGIAWCSDPFEMIAASFVSRESSNLGDEISGKSVSIKTHDPVPTPFTVKS